MFRVFSCIFVEHDLRYIASAVLICVIGSFLTIRLFSRARRGSGIEKVIWLFLAGFMGGSTTWTTHFLAMLGYLSGGQAGYEPAQTLLSFMIAVATATIGLSIASYGGRSLLAEAGGMVMGLGIAAMHYTGMAAYEVQGSIDWDRRYVIASLIFAGLFGVLTTNRVVRPVTHFCKYGSVLAMILAIATTHFTAMGAIDVVLDPRAVMQNEVVPPVVLGFGVLSLMLILLALTAATYLIDARTTQAAVEQYRRLSLHDALTGLANRAAFNEQLADIAMRPADLASRIAVLSFDLNRFKEVNDVHGHAAGDEVLRRIGGRLAQAVGEGEFIARVGGDEFVALKHLYYKRSDAMTLANRLLVEICKPIEWNGNTLTVGSSVGIALYPEEAKTIDDLVAQADVAMYRAKQSGGSMVCFYDSSMDQAARERNALAMDMRSGLVAGQFELYYQRQNDTFSEEVVGFEVLLRWNHPTRGLVNPGEFIPIAERTGFIVELGEWVLRSACLEAATWKNPFGIAVNVAAQQLADPRFPTKVRDILNETGLSADRLELEITESGIIGDHQRALQIVRHLKSLGVKIAMDDYGTGYSSLSTLMSFPFDKIKIDRTFVDGLSNNEQSAAIVRSTLILASSLHIPVLAEGVETDAHIAFLRKEGCMQVQGYLFGKPGPRAGIEHIVNGEARDESTPVVAKVA
ncbi:putative bifunctional diguanylate cyclase/phosphodiesterase [Neorhizobium galegae]|uniref:Putative signaling protein with diguanylate cyclase/phosphodiesterase activity n=1 Tax=Neorhizobium galegae bv. orientalis str. HAMBI 540 TaxID=1028800 RepID=A0A068SUA8_NEOGA|nr:bifunctional diguanylate cyclase/phosphodiesterase [Neorhizobium galegae]CDN48680.1 Putative signaling protein with diguanylate cyclase/phosphodiesterase activity [Neorhizobium galegae bv. orientalis str. HAMBI 540]CDZ52558.1 Putative signaling protein with diguanylate cyclase/phosphodiesterase activity [Neorhizobium galegae bv. orientalis]